MGTFSHIHVAFLILRPVAIIRHSITFSVVTIVFMYLYSTHCFLYISDSTDEESLFDNQEFVKLMIISFILMTFEIDSRVMLLGEIRSQSLLRFNELYIGTGEEEEKAMDLWTSRKDRFKIEPGLTNLSFLENLGNVMSSKPYL